MALSEDAKRQAMSAVREARPYLSDMQGASHADLNARQAQFPAPATQGIHQMPEAERRRAMSAVKEAEPHIQMIRETGSTEIYPQTTPANDNSRKSAERITRMERSGFEPEAIQKNLTKQDFARE